MFVKNLGDGLRSVLRDTAKNAVAALAEMGARAAAEYAMLAAKRLFLSKVKFMMKSSMQTLIICSSDGIVLQKVSIGCSTMSSKRPIAMGQRAKTPMLV